MIASLATDIHCVTSSNEINFLPFLLFLFIWKTGIILFLIFNIFINVMRTLSCQWFYITADIMTLSFLQLVSL